jgi:hypothetical protein
MLRRIVASMAWPSAAVSLGFLFSGLNRVREPLRHQVNQRACVGACREDRQRKGLHAISLGYRQVPVG